MSRRKQRIQERARTRLNGGAFEYFFLAVLTMAMVALGAVMVFSASLGSAFFDNQDSYFYIKRELFFAVMGIGIMFALARYDFTRLRKAGPAMIIVAAALLVLVFIPGIGVSAKGARRWIGLGLSSFQPQPSEFAKLAVIVFVAGVMSAKPKLLGSLREMLVPLLALPLVVCVLVLAEPDMGTAITIALAVAVMLIIGGVNPRVMAPAIGAAFVVGFLSVIIKPHQMDRITSFLDPWQDAQGTGHQIIQSWVAIGSGGLSGVGLGNSVQKFNYLPEPHTDMIFSIIGEELGIIGALVIVACFSAFAFMGFRIAVKCRNPFGKYLAAGITAMLIGQAVINLCAVTGLMPLTGVPLPLISYGGSSLVVILASIGILLNVAVNPRGKIAAAPQRKPKAVKSRDSGRRDGRPSGAGARAGRRANG